MLISIENNFDKPWDWGWLSDNPNITEEFIQKNTNKENKSQQQKTENNKSLQQKLLH